MKYDKKIYLSALYIILGAALFILGSTEVIDEFWNGFGSSILVVGVLLMIKQIRYRTNAEYRENIDIAISDERNGFLHMKAWSWAGYLFIMISAVSVIVFKLMGRDDIMMYASTNVCSVMILYWISYLYVKHKY